MTDIPAHLKFATPSPVVQTPFVAQKLTTAPVKAPAEKGPAR